MWAPRTTHRLAIAALLGALLHGADAAGRCVYNAEGANRAWCRSHCSKGSARSQDECEGSGSGSSNQGNQGNQGSCCRWDASRPLSHTPRVTTPGSAAVAAAAATPLSPGRCIYKVGASRGLCRAHCFNTAAASKKDCTAGQHAACCTWAHDDSAGQRNATVDKHIATAIATTHGPTQPPHAPLTAMPPPSSAAAHLPATQAPSRCTYSADANRGLCRGHCANTAAANQRACEAGLYGICCTWEPHGAGPAGAGAAAASSPSPPAAATTETTATTTGAKDTGTSTVTTRAAPTTVHADRAKCSAYAEGVFKPAFAGDEKASCVYWNPGRTRRLTVPPCPGSCRQREREREVLDTTPAPDYCVCRFCDCSGSSGSVVPPPNTNSGELPAGGAGRCVYNTAGANRAWCRSHCSKGSARSQDECEGSGRGSSNQGNKGDCCRWRSGAAAGDSPPRPTTARVPWGPPTHPSSASASPSTASASSASPQAPGTKRPSNGPAGTAEPRAEAAVTSHELQTPARKGRGAGWFVAAGLLGLIICGGAVLFAVVAKARRRGLMDDIAKGTTDPDPGRLPYENPVYETVLVRPLCGMALLPATLPLCFPRVL